MSPSNPINPVDSNLNQSSSSDIQIAPSKSRKICWGKLVVNAAMLSSQQKAVLPVSPIPSRFSPWLISLAYPIGRYLLMPFFFKRIEVEGRENLPRSGPVIFAPTHRSRWDAFMSPFAAGYDVTGRHLRFMVSANEVVGFQGWFIRRLGGFPVDTTRPAIASLRHGVELLQAGEALVIFPEGDIFRELEIQPLKPGLARLAIQAELSQPNLGVNIVPIYLRYTPPLVPWRSRVKIRIGETIQVTNYRDGTPKQNARRLTADLQSALRKVAGLKS